jgi:hypothetical protein
MDRSVLSAGRIRKINGSFAFIEHRFMHEGHLPKLSACEILLYFFFALVGDANGVSFYGTDKILHLLKLDEGDYFSALSSLQRNDYIRTLGNKVQLLSLPEIRARDESGKRAGEQRCGEMQSLAEILRAAGGYHG